MLDKKHSEMQERRRVTSAAARIPSLFIAGGTEWNAGNAPEDSAFATISITW
jgi:hypothetical protein